MEILYYLLILVNILCVLSSRKVNKSGASTSTLSPSCPVHKKKTILDRPLKIGAWNVQKLGQSKIKNLSVLEIIVKVMVRYDIILIQEVVDSKEKVPYQLLDALNKHSNDTQQDSGGAGVSDFLRKSSPAERVYEMALSERIGKSRYKEQYAFYYRKDRVSLYETLQFPDPQEIFQVEPFVVVFDTPTADVQRIALIPIHTSPENAAIEIDGLVDVYEYVVKTLSIKDALILGDFNGGCSYVTEKQWQNIRLYTDKQFDWLISDHEDTTTKATTCPYDRIVAAGTSLKAAIYANRAIPFYFDEVFPIEDEALVKAVSDHYPVQVLIRSKVSSTQEYQQNVEEGLFIELKSTPEAIHWLKESCLTVVRDGNKAKMDKDINNENYRTRRNERRRKSNYTDHASNYRRTSNKGTMQQGEGIEEENNKCGRSPNVVVAESQLLIAEFVSEGIGAATETLDSLVSGHSCIFAQQDISLIKYKLIQGILKEEKSLVSSPKIMIRLICYSDSCKVIITKESPIIYS